MKRLLVAILLLLSACASQPPLPTEVRALQERVQLLESLLQECESDGVSCLDYLKDCEASRVQ